MPVVDRNWPREIAMFNAGMSLFAPGCGAPTVHLNILTNGAEVELEAPDGQTLRAWVDGRVATATTLFRAAQRAVMFWVG